MIQCVHKDSVHHVWSDVRPLLEKAVEHSCGECGIQDIYQKIEDGKMGLIIISDDNNIIAAAVVEFMNYPQITSLRVAFLGGKKMADWLGDLIEFLDKWASENNMARIELMGRDGWVKVLERYGYKKQYTFMTKELDNG